MVATRLAKVSGVSAAVFVVLWLPIGWTFVKGDGNNIRRSSTSSLKADRPRASTPRSVLGLQWGHARNGFSASVATRSSAALVEQRWWLAIWLVLRPGDGRLIRRSATDVTATRRCGLPPYPRRLVAAIVRSATSSSRVQYLNRWTWVLSAALGMLLRGLWLVPPSRRQRCASRHPSRR
jgi:hypothetical protein